MENSALNRDNRGFYVLRRTYSDYFRRSAYVSSRTPIIDRITEYDIKSANTTMLRRAKLIKEKDLQAIEALPKHDREVMIGNMIKRDKQIGKVIRKGIVEGKRLLFQANGVQSDEIQAIRSDAVFIIGRRLKTIEFGPITFRPTSYSMYMKLAGLEYYYRSSDNHVDIKGINDSIVEEPDHQAGIVNFMATVMGYLTRNRRDALRKYLIEFSEAYKAMELPLCYYREMSKLNAYRTTMEISDFSYATTMPSEDDKKIINGIYNYNRFVLPVIQQYL